MNKYINSGSTVLLLIILSVNINFGGEIRDKAIQLITENFSEDIVVISTFKLTVNKKMKQNSEKFAQQRFFSNYIYYYEIKKNNEIIGFAVLDNVLGKVKPITYLVIFENDFSVKSVDIIKYREQYGGAVANEEWLKQFRTKTVESELELNSNIDGISGATISAKAIVKGVKRILYLVNNLGEDERNLLVSIEQEH